MKKFKARLLDFGKKHHWAMIALRKARNIKQKIRFWRCSFGAKTDSKLVVFESFMGRSYSDNPRAIFEAMLEDKKLKEYKFVWAFKKAATKIKTLPELEKMVDAGKVKVVSYGSKAYYKAMASAKLVVSNSRIPECVKFRKDQKYVQTWHGTPLKKLGFDVTHDTAMNTTKDIQDKHTESVKKYDYFISPSKFCSEKFESAFHLKEIAPKCRLLEIGYPRNDYLLNYKKADLEDIKNKLGLNDKKFKKKQIILYAPTWRDDQHESGKGYVYDCPVNFEKLRKELGDDYIILFRAHYFVANSFDFSKYKDFVIDVSRYENIAELFVISDILITDYSSVFFDYSILKRPIILYMYDYDHYVGDLRGFYFDPSHLPWPIVKTEEALIDAIRSSKPAMNEFAKQFIELEDGKASKRLIKELRKDGVVE